MTQPLEEYTEQQIPVDQSDDGVWGTSTIATLNLFGRALAGVVSIAAAAVATITLDTTQAQKSVIVVTGTPSVDVTILVPNGLKRRYKVRSAIGATNMKKVLFNTVGGTGPSIELYPQQMLQFYSDGSNLYALNHPVVRGGGFPDVKNDARPGIFFDNDKLAGFARIGNGIFVYPGSVAGTVKPYIAFLKGNTAAEPALGFSTDFSSYNSGFYFPDDNAVAVTLKGNEKLRLTEAALYIGRSTAAENVEGAYFNLDSGKLTIERSSGGLLVLNRMGQVGPSAIGGGRIVQFFNNGTDVAHEAGHIDCESPTTVSYNTTSDARLKTDIREPHDLWGLVHAVRAKLFNWRHGIGGDVLGIIAQEAQPHWGVLEGAISGRPDDLDHMMGADYGRITPMLLWAIQDMDRRLRKAGL